MVEAQFVAMCYFECQKLKYSNIVFNYYAQLPPIKMKLLSYLYVKLPQVKVNISLSLPQISPTFPSFPTFDSGFSLTHFNMLYTLLNINQL